MCSMTWSVKNDWLCVLAVIELDVIFVNIWMEVCLHTAY